MNKKLCFILIALLAIALLTACASVPSASQGGDTLGQVPPDEVSDAGEESEAMAAPNLDPADPVEEPSEFPKIEACQHDLTGETLYIHQHAGREGPLAAIIGEAFAFATEDAITEINESGGVCGAELELVYRETQYDVEQEIVAYEEARAFDPKPKFILTYGSGATIALKDRVVEDEIVNFVSGLNAEAIYNPPNGYTFAFLPIYSDQFAGFLTWLSENWDDVKPDGAGDEIVVGVIGWANAFGAGATTSEALAIAEELGITVLPLEEQPISPDADVTGQLQNLLLGGANVIYNQNLSFGTSQVIGTLHALSSWDQVLVGGVNWATNNDVFQFLGENAQLAEGFYGVFPHLAWNDVDEPGVQQALAIFEANGREESEQNNTYITAYATIHAVAAVLRRAINMVGFDALDSAAMVAAMENMGYVDALGIFGVDATGGNRSSGRAQIRRAVFNDGKIEFEIVEDFFELPDAKPK